LPIGELVDRFGEDYPVPEVGERARCSRCGNLGADVSAAVRAMRDPERFGSDAERGRIWYPTIIRNLLARRGDSSANGTIIPRNSRPSGECRIIGPNYGSCRTHRNKAEALG
jgi:hypothetical protein